MPTTPKTQDIEQQDIKNNKIPKHLIPNKNEDSKNIFQSSRHHNKIQDCKTKSRYQKKSKKKTVKKTGDIKKLKVSTN